MKEIMNFLQDIRKGVFSTTFAFQRTMIVDHVLMRFRRANNRFSCEFQEITAEGGLEESLLMGK